VEKKTISKPESRSLFEFKRVPLYGVEDDRRWKIMSPRYPSSINRSFLRLLQRPWRFSGN
ncbi:unnamed protein product, partial [Brassica oleracea var. botrytis]